MFGSSSPMRFRFTLDGGDQAELSVTYLGRISRKDAEADARRRFQEWKALANPLARRWASDQLVVS